MPFAFGLGFNKNYCWMPTSIMSTARKVGLASAKRMVLQELLLE